MKLNSSMRTLISANAIDFKTPIKVHPALTAILEPGVLRLDSGAIILKALEHSNRVITESDFLDETGYEAFANHIHVEDYVRDKALNENLLSQSIAFAKELNRLLQRSFPNDGFEVIVAMSGSRSAVRFHKRRAGQHWLAEDLEGYQEEALMIL